MTIYLGQYNFEPYSKTTRVNDKVVKIVTYMSHFNRLGFMSMNFADVTLEHKSRRLLQFVQLTGITTIICPTNWYCQILLTFKAIWRQNFDNIILGHTVM